METVVPLEQPVVMNLPPLRFTGQRRFPAMSVCLAGAFCRIAFASLKIRFLFFSIELGFNKRYPIPAGKIKRRFD